MRTVFIALTCVILAACSRETQPPQQQQAAAPAPPPHYEIALTDPSQLALPANSPIHVTVSGASLRLQGAVRNPSPQIRTDGASVALGSTLEETFAGHQVRVTMEARGIGGATAFTSAYSTNGNGNSGWRRLRLTDQFAPVSYVFAVPALGRRGDDFIGINPPDAGAVEIRSVRAEIIGAAPPADGLRTQPSP